MVPATGPVGSPDPKAQAQQQALNVRPVVHTGQHTAPVAQDGATSEAHRRFWQADIAKWRPIIQAAGQFAD